ncbi:hypothetical protein GH714_028531 [Hevea brasiliensis]|uniref:Uncharacterized protein n=1 Tax=Hevea brasiliensis TaxID=3981 RepID=A0A6A6LJR2_HEVBR|nr:hypothetical protein GH714_028531 [Hevea brasiliensis]
MARVVGNLALFLDLASPWPVIPDRKTQPAIVDFVLNLPTRDPHTYATSLANKSFKSDGEARRQRVVARGEANSKVNGVDFDSDEENGNGTGEGEEEEFDWRRTVKEIEEMRELEKKAEEFLNKAEDSESEDRKEAEEGKRWEENLFNP